MIRRWSTTTTTSTSIRGCTSTWRVIRRRATIGTPIRSTTWQLSAAISSATKRSASRNDKAPSDYKDRSAPDFLKALRSSLRPRRLVRHVTRDLPAAIGLAAEDIEAGFSSGRLGSILRRDLQRPHEPHDGEIARDDDLLDFEVVVISLRRIGQGHLQIGTERAVGVFGLAAKIRKQIRREQRAY